MHKTKTFVVPAVDRHNLRAALLQLEAEESIPRSDVEHTLAAQILGNWELREPPSSAHRDRRRLQSSAVRHLERVPPT